MVLSRLSQLGSLFLMQSGIGYSHILPQSQEALSSYYFLSTMRGNCDKHGKEKLIQVPIGMSMLEAAHKNDRELEVNSYLFAYGPLSSHVLDHLRLSNTTDMEYCNKLEDPADEENDMLNPAFGLTEMSCLGCQVIAKPELDGMWLALPEAT